MAMLYGQDGEEERRRREMQAMFGYEPGYGEAPQAMDPALELAMQDAAPAASPMDEGPSVYDQARGITPETGQTMASQGLPEPPGRESSTTAQKIGLILAGLGDAMNAPLATRTGRRTNYAGQASQLVSSDVASRQKRADDVWRNKVQQGFTNRRLKIGEGQESRAEDRYQQYASADSPMARVLHEDLYRKIDRGELPDVTREMVAKSSPRDIEASGWLKEAGTYRGVEQNKMQADAAQERRMGEEASDAGDMIRALQSINYPGADKIDPNDPEAVRIFFQANEGAMNRASRERNAQRAARQRQQLLPQPGIFRSQADLIDDMKAAPDRVAEYMEMKEREIGQSSNAQERMMRTFQLKQAKDVVDRQLPGFQYVGTTPPTEAQYKQALEQKQSAEEFVRQTELGIEALKKVSGFVNQAEALVPLTDEYAAMQNLQTIQEKRNALARTIYGFGAPQAHEMGAIKRSVVDLTSMINLGTGQVEDLARAEIERTREKAQRNLFDLKYSPMKEQRPDGQQGSSGDQLPSGYGRSDYERDRKLLEGSR